MFWAGRHDAHLCSSKCRMAAKRKRDKAERAPNYCAYCFRPFYGLTGNTMYCCRAHRQAAYRARKAHGGQYSF